MSEKKSKKSPGILDRSYQFDIQKLMQGSDSYKSLMYGIVTVVVLFVVVALGLRSLSQNKAQIDNGGIATQSTISQPKVDNRYTVVEGDTLWSIADQKYADGSRWHEIASANNISDPTSLEKGMKLVIPAQKTELSAQMATVVTPTPPTVILPEQAVVPSQKITGTTYNVVHGDFLWDIAVRAYGDGYRWVDIAKANNLSDPDKIFSGNVLTLPRP